MREVLMAEEYDFDELRWSSGGTAAPVETDDDPDDDDDEAEG